MKKGYKPFIHNMIKRELFSYGIFNESRRFRNLFIVALLFLLIECAKSPESPTRLQWQFNEDGWVLQKGFSGNGFEKFFAIGTWHVPGYVFTDSMDSDMQQYQNNAALFRERTDPINMVFMTPGLQKDYMSEKIHILNPFYPILHKYLDQVAGLPDGKDKDYYRSQYIRKMADSPEFEAYLDSEIQKILETLPNNQYIYSHIDEIASGGIGKWAAPPSVGAKIYERVKYYDPNALVFVDLLGHSRGSSYLFEEKYLQTHDSLPKDPPYELVDPEALRCEIPLLGFYQAHNGLPVYQFNERKYSYTEYDFDTLKSLWYENTKLIASAYKGNGDVFGINAFRDYFAYPVLSGMTVDALREGLGPATPIWIYFDGNGYAKPANISPKEYIEIVKCQIYTSVIHGATGILFWNDWSKTPEVFDALLPMLEELNKNLPIVKLKTIDKKVDDDLHILVKEGKNGSKHIIATNTSKTDKIKINIQGVDKEELEPLEVYISEI